MKRIELILFLAILAIGIFLRIYQLGAVPPGLNRDEASIGYTAYSLLKTGKDEYSRAFPLSFESFGDWKLPAYIYLDIPFVAVLGLNEVAVRLPSVLAAIGTIILTYFLVRRLFKNNTLALLSMGLLAISPWHIHLSRAAYEANVAVFFVTAGVVCFFAGLKRRWLLLPAAILLALSYYTYHGNHVFTTLLVGSLLALYWKRLTISKEVLVSAAVFVLMVGFILSQTLLSANETKLSGSSILSDTSNNYTRIQHPRSLYHNQLLAKLVNNKAVFAAETITQNYLKAFGPEFLFISGGENKTHNIPNFGNMYIVEAPFLLFGFFYFLFKMKGRERLLLICWLLISPIAASITKDAPHSTRMFAVFPVLSILTAAGIFWFIQVIEKSKFRVVILSILLLLFIANISLYLSRYFVEFPQTRGEYWGVGYQKLYTLLDTPDYRSKKVVIDHPEYSPYIFLLFYNKVDPAYFKSVIAGSQKKSATSAPYRNVIKYSRFRT